MGIEVSSKSFINDVSTYMKTRFSPRVFIPLVVLLTILGLRSYVPNSSLALLTTISLAILLVVQFRLWDDLADRSRDQSLHPERVLCTTVFIRGFWSLCFTICVMNVLLVSQIRNRNTLSALVAADVMMLCWYLVPCSNA